MKVKALSNFAIPRLNMTFKSGEVYEMMNEIGQTLLATKKFVKVLEDDDVSKNGDVNGGGYQHREMRTRRRKL